MERPLRRLAALHRALGHRTRLRILAMLRDGELCVCQITAVLSCAPSTVSAHLAVLRRVGLIRERKEGRWVHYGLVSSPETQTFLDLVDQEAASDPQARADARLVGDLRRVSVEELCRSGLDLERLGVRAPNQEEQE